MGKISECSHDTAHEPHDKGSNTFRQRGLLAAAFRVELVGVGATPSKIHFDPIQKFLASF
jgi:hypothetical protein